MEAPPHRPGKALVTGGSGFVGANLVRRLLADGHEVHLFLRPGHQTWRIDGIRDAVHLHEVDLLDSAALGPTLSSIRPDWLFHLATHGAYSWETDRARIFDTNLHATIALVEAALKVGFEAFIHAGSSSEYGARDHAPAESEAPEPNSDYAVAKAAATLYCQFAARREEAPLTTLRLYSAYGPFEDPRRLIPTLLRCGKEGRFPPLVAPETARDYLHVADVVEALILAARHARDHRGAIFNIGSGSQTPLRELVETVSRLLHLSAEPAWGTMPARDWDTAVWVADPRKAEREWGWRASLGLEEGLKKTLLWMENGS